MIITQIELYRIAIPFVRPYKLSKVYGTLTHADAVVVSVTTDAGVVGWGEADPQAPFTADTPESVITTIRDEMAPHLLGQDPTRLAQIENEMDRTVPGNMMARGAVNMALFDVLGKVHQLPAHTFLGGLIHKQLPLLGPIGSGSPKEDSEAINSLIRDGFGTIMIKMGALPISDEIDRMVAATKMFGDSLIFIADANQGWQLDEALQFVDGIAGSEPIMLEQPIGRDDMDGLKQIGERANCLISADESVVTMEDASRLLRLEAADVISIKVSKNGGLTKSGLIANAAKVAGIQCLMNSMLEFGISQAASLQLGCTLPNLMNCGHAYMSVLRMADDITDFGDNIKNAVVTVPSSPGLGVQIDEIKLEKYTRQYVKV